MDKKRKQLGMNPSTASHRLVKDLLYEYGIARQHKCCSHCGEPMMREDFSIEHITPWLDSEDPVKLYFDLNNVDFSHHACNIAAARRPTKKFFTEEEKENNNRRMWRHSKRKHYDSASRREKYLNKGY